MNPVILRFTGGMNNNDPSIDLFGKNHGEVVNISNANTRLRGRLKLLRPLSAINTTPESSSVHSVFRAQNKVLVGSGINLKYVNGAALFPLLTGLSGSSISFAHAGDFVFIGDGTNKKAVYLPTPIATDWGQDPPTTAPVVVPGAAATGATPSGTYSCYYRHKITLPGGTIIRNSLSPVGTVVTGGAFKIEWSGLVHSTFVGATRQLELFRTKTGWAATNLVTTLNEGTTTYSDDILDALVEGNTDFAEDGYYGPPDGVDIAFYHPGANRMFCAVGSDVYWSQPDEYHTFLYDEAADEYTNVNSVFLAGENVTAMILWDEQLYIGSQKGWHRLRGYNPDYWIWEPTSAIKGPISWQSVVVTPYGVIYPGNDKHLWIFNGFESKLFVDQFVFSVEPRVDSHGTFDGTLYRLFYGDPDYPELIIDLSGLPASPAKVLQGARNTTASCYDRSSHTFYLGDAEGYVRTNDDASQSVTMSFTTGEIPTSQLIKLGDIANLMIEANTKGSKLIITQIEDGKAQVALTPVVTNSMQRVAVPISLNTYRTLAFTVSITTKEEIELREPWLLSKEDDG